MGTICWSVSGLFLNASFNLFNYGRCQVETTLHGGRVGTGQVCVGWWVNGLLRASFYHHQHRPPPTFPC